MIKILLDGEVEDDEPKNNNKATIKPIKKIGADSIVTVNPLEYADTLLSNKEDNKARELHSVAETQGKISLEKKIPKKNTVKNKYNVM